jgi:hypothetical protein
MAITAGLPNIAHWMFSYEYYNMVRIIPFVLDEIAPPEKIFMQNTAQFWIWTVINSIAAVLLGFSTYFGYIANHFKTVGISLMILCLLNTVSVLYLGLSIYRIRKLTKQN